MSMCLDHSCRCGFLTRASAPWLSPLICTTYGSFPIYLGKPMSFRTCTIHWLCFAHDDIAIYSDSVLEVATEVCFLLPMRLVLCKAWLHAQTCFYGLFCHLPSLHLSTLLDDPLQLDHNRSVNQ